MELSEYQSSKVPMSFNDFLEDLTTVYEEDPYDVERTKKALKTLSPGDLMIFAFHLYMDDYKLESSVFNITRMTLINHIKATKRKIRKALCQH